VKDSHGQKLSALCAAALFALGGSLVMLRAAADPAPSRDQASLVILGKQLFFDTRLSADGKNSCATCHRPEHAYTDNRTVARGVSGFTGTRNTPSLLNVPVTGALFWDGRREKLEEAALDPLAHPRELAFSDDAALDAVMRSPAYGRSMADAFGGKADVSAWRPRIGVALAAYIKSLPHPESAFDRYRAQHNLPAFSQQAREGLRLFSGKAGCASCHRIEGSPARFTDDRFHATGTGLQKVARNLPALTSQATAIATDGATVGREIADLAATGRFMVTHQPADIGLFRTPSLRYVAQTVPYMHDGSVATLEEAVDQEVYWRGLSSGHPVSLTVSERLALIAFLRSLSPESSAAKSAAH
jgi:cytochrome c peroxidase